MSRITDSATSDVGEMVPESRDERISRDAMRRSVA
jgi:hypothetical protein